MGADAARTSSILAAGTAGYLAIAIIVFGLRRADYSHVRNTISELGEFGAADSALVSYGVFLPIGIVLGPVAVLCLRRREQMVGARQAAALAASVAIGYLVAAFFPCDPGSPLSGSGRQAVHNLGGAVEYFGGAIALFWLAALKRWRWYFLAAGVITLAVAFGISAPELASVRGLLQRAAEASLFGSIVLATRLKTT